jgi:DNA-binding transcriptional LysR family regulator
MDIRRLEAFRKVYELRSFSRAGQELFLSQPTVSAHVASLEEELGVRLFDRLGRGVLPTPAAEALNARAVEIFNALERARAEVLLLREKVAGELVLGGSTIPAHYLMPRILSGFLPLYPEVRAEVLDGDTEQILERTSRGEVVLGLVGAKAHHPELVFEPLFRDQLVVVASPAFVRAHYAAIDAGDPAGWPWIMRERGSGTRRAFEQALERQSVSLRSLNRAVQVGGTEAALRCAMAGLGATVTSLLAADGAISRGELVEVPALALDMDRSFYLVHHSGREFLPTATRFRDFALKWGKNFAEARRAR